MTTEDALIELGESTAAAVAGVLAMFAPESVDHGAVSVVPADGDPLAGISTPAVVADVSYVNGVTGGNLFAVTVRAARCLAAAMMGADPTGEGELSELELSAVSEAMNQMMAAAAGATSKVLGQEVEIDPPKTRVLETAAPAEPFYESTPHATIVGFSLFGEPCRLVQLVPNAFVVRMVRALGEQSGVILDELPPDAGSAQLADRDIMRRVTLRLWAELGRVRMPIGQAVGLAPGSVVELDRGVDDLVDLYVNGQQFALGRLLLTDDGEWSIRIEEISPATVREQVTEKGVD